jgi:hypothetical protein
MTELMQALECGIRNVRVEDDLSTGQWHKLGLSRGSVPTTEARPKSPQDWEGNDHSSTRFGTWTFAIDANVNTFAPLFVAVCDFLLASKEEQFHIP